MRLYPAFIGLLLVCAAAGSLSADDLGESRFSPGLVVCLNRISGHIYNDQFDRAGQLIDSLQNSGEYPAFCHFFRAALYQAQMMAAESDEYHDRYFDVLDSLENDARAMLTPGGDSALAYLYLGHTYAFRSLYYGRTGSLWKALKGGLAARKAYSRGYECDSTFHDLALGLGSYWYWKSVKTDAINWTPLFKDEKRKGIEMLRRAADSSQISRDAAIVALIWVYINEKRYAEAIRTADAMRRIYPDGLTFLWALGETYFKMNDCRAAVEIYETILARLKREPGNYYNFIEASYYLSACLRNETADSTEAVAKLDRLQQEINSAPIPDKTRKRQKKKLKEILRKLD